MKNSEFIEKVNKKEIVNGTKFEVYSKDKKIGEIGVIDTTIVFLDFEKVPSNIYVGEYTFKEVLEK